MQFQIENRAIQSHNSQNAIQMRRTREKKVKKNIT